MILDLIARMLGVPRDKPTPTSAEADRVIVKADRVLEEFRRTQDAMRGRPRVP